MVVHIGDLDPTAPDGDTEPVAVLDDELHEVKEAVQTSFGIEHNNANGAHALPNGNTSARPAASTDGRIYINEETKTIQKDDGVAWADLIHYYTRIKIGTFTGDGTSNKAITGLGFAPTGVFVIPLTGSNPSFFKGINFATGDAHKFSDNTTDTAAIDTLDSDGFTVDANANVNGIVYQYIAIRDRA